MRLRLIAMWTAIVLTALEISAQSTSTTTPKGKEPSSPRQVNVSVDPRSSGEAEAELLTNGFRKLCPNVSIVRDASEAEYVILASESDPWRGFLLHYYITVYDGRGKVVFATDKNHDKSATKPSVSLSTRKSRTTPRTLFLSV